MNKTPLTVAGAEFLMPGISGDPANAGPVKAAIRPEQFVLNTDSEIGIPAVVDHSVFLGLNTHYFVRLADGSNVEVVQESEIEELLAPGTEIHLGLKVHKVNVFTADGSRNLLTWSKDGAAAESVAVAS